MSRALDDPRILRGMQAQLALRQARLDAGDRPIGWKVGYGSPAAMGRLGTSAPLVGFLHQGACLPSGATVSVGDWTHPVLEPEIAVHMGADLPGGSAIKVVQDAVGAIGPAIELADVQVPSQNPEEILAGNIHHRFVVLGKVEQTRPGHSVAGLLGRLLRDGEELAATDDPTALPGDLLQIVAYTADLLEQLGHRLRAGEVIITGSIVPPVRIEGGGSFRYFLDPVGQIDITLTLER